MDTFSLMASMICAICGKASATGNNVSHSNRKTKRVWRPNLQKIRVQLTKGPATVLVCTRCIKGNKIQKAVKTK